jgi:DNA-binding response OmpR family regulator
MAEVVDYALSAAGYDCRRASTRPAISRLLRKRIKFDALFLHVGALEDFGQLRKWVLHGAGKGLPVVLIAARPRSHVPADFLDRADTFLAVPFEIKKLLATIQKVLAN